LLLLWPAWDPGSVDASKLQAYFLTDAWILVAWRRRRGELRKALGGAYSQGLFDEGQKIPPKLEFQFVKSYPRFLISAANLGLQDLRSQMNGCFIM